ncbi:MAG TPA: CHAT domain-containing protein [Terriglobia bacterium]|nr:CHAT domain-containing protein [Terriglobia bacterium]
MLDEPDGPGNTAGRLTFDGTQAGTPEPDESATNDIPSATPTQDRSPARIRIRLLHGDIGQAGEPGHAPSGETVPIDAIAVGHYKNVAPVDAELALDLAMRRTLPSGGNEGLIITQLYQRGIISGEPARPFFLADPRCPSRTIAIAGMGYPGNFGVAELTVLVRELFWSLSRLGKRHLATVLIGSGNGNIEPHRALGAWIRGLRGGLEEAAAGGRSLEVVTFVEFNPKRLVELNDALQRELENLEVLEFTPLTQAEIAAALESDSPPPRPSKDVPPIYFSPEVVSGEYRPSVVTNAALVGERRQRMDWELVQEEQESLLAAKDAGAQLKEAASLCRRLIPEELQPQLLTSAPLIVICNRKTARLPWELLAPPGIAGNKDIKIGPEESLLGLSRGLTRELKVQSDLPPGPPHRSSKDLRVLIVADPASDRPLAAAQQEARLLADLFQTYNNGQRAKSGRNRIEVTPLIGPTEASHKAVLDQLQENSYDALHFAGHCEYSQAHPRASGWIFSNGRILTAEDLSRLDRIPRFVFSNACESGVISLRDSSRVAPGFAESFFLRGVGNFVCTAWQINDQAAQEFAKILYRRLLGIDGAPQPMYVAMQDARLAVRTMTNGFSSWGAYQHYGDPYFRFFDA